MIHSQDDVIPGVIDNKREAPESRRPDTTNESVLTKIDQIRNSRVVLKEGETIIETDDQGKTIRISYRLPVLLFPPPIMTTVLNGFPATSNSSLPDATNEVGI